MNYNLIQRAAILPDDFVIDGVLNRERYIIEHGFSDIGKWFDEHQCHVTAEIIGAIVIGSNAYCDFRWRQRLEIDEKWDMTKTTLGKIMNAGIIS